jgi:hypothetical protein
VSIIALGSSEKPVPGGHHGVYICNRPGIYPACVLQETYKAHVKELTQAIEDASEMGDVDTAQVWLKSGGDIILSITEAV